MRDNLTFGINESQKFIRLDLNQKDFENEEGPGIIWIFNSSSSIEKSYQSLAGDNVSLVHIIAKSSLIYSLK